jgi:hypothetical protein
MLPGDRTPTWATGGSGMSVDGVRPPGRLHLLIEEDAS